MDAPNYISKLILNWFESVSFRFGMRANLPGVGAGQGLRGKGPGVQPVERQENLDGKILSICFIRSNMVFNCYSVMSSWRT